MARATKGSLTAAVAICARVRGGAAPSPTSLSSSRNLHSSGRKDDSRRQEYSTGAAAAVEVEGGVPGGLRRLPGRQGWDLAGAIEYLEYRRSLYGEITHKALLVDAVGTLVVPSQPMAQVWLFSLPQGKGDFINFQNSIFFYVPAIRYVDDGRPFWQYIVSSSTGCSNLEYFEELYKYYTTEKALNCDHWFDAVAVSAEVPNSEKPNPTIFLKACELLGVKPEEAVHVGDDRRNDIWGARDAGCDAWLWGGDVHSFKEV
ncbi:hypothetical protein B296_00023322 [Ensete ventricosum]|uniref:Haloacid dehalogenase-like hydrolase domain-containing protein 3 n=1 Tax=Ensete ventricosum TaxID=4639 RepID=A0A427AJI5_ENSVE|nr:hypothetical protein B296_00023322 [Ensete ventricosum]